MNETVLLSLGSLTKSYGVVKALTDISFSVREGEIHTILGENGAGKSTLVKIIAGETAPDSGAVELGGRPVRVYTPAAAHEAGVYMVHQELAVFENLTVAENMFPGFRLRRMGRLDRQALNQRTQEQLDLFGLKTIRPEQSMASVTLGGQQMVEILRCIAARPKLIILDEPTSGLNDSESDLLMDILARLRAENITIIYISHRLKEIKRISDRITVLRDGTYVTTFENSPALSENDLINSMVGRDLGQSLYSRKAAGCADMEKVIFEARALVKTKALFPTDICLHAGEVVGVFGLEGSGTVRLSRMLYGLEKPDSGEVFVNGAKVRGVTPGAMVRRRVMYLNNNRKLAGLLLNSPVADNIVLPVLRDMSGRLGFIDEKKKRQAARAFVQRFSIALPSLYTRPKNLSGGNQQKVMLSACLAPEPQVLIVNEPTRGIDVGAKAQIHDFLLGIAQNGVGILIFSSEMPELMKLCDRILVMRNGRVAGEIAVQEFSEQVIMRFAAMG